MNRRPLVYIAGPLGLDVPLSVRQGIDRPLPEHHASARVANLNARLAMTVGAEMLDAGLAPIVPHLSLFWDSHNPRDYEVWMALDLELVSRCDYLYRLAGESHGADREVAHARECAIPVWLLEHGTLPDFIASVVTS